MRRHLEGHILDLDEMRHLCEVLQGLWCKAAVLVSVSGLKFSTLGYLESCMARRLQADTLVSESEGEVVKGLKQESPEERMFEEMR